MKFILTEAIDEKFRTLLYTLNSLPVMNGWKLVKYELIKDYEDVLGQFPVGTVLTHHNEAGEETFTKTEEGWWDHFVPHPPRTHHQSDFDIAHWLVARGNISRGPIEMKDIPQQVDESVNNEYQHRYYLCGNYGLVGTPYPKSVSREEALAKLASGNLLSSWFYVHEKSTFDDGIRREAYPYCKQLTTPEDFDNIEAQWNKHLQKRKDFTECSENNKTIASMLHEAKRHQDAVFNGETFWIGSASSIDGVIEEVHTWEEASKNGFHHTFTFSEAQVEKIDSGENFVFWIQNDDIDSWELLKPSIRKSVLNQIEFIDQMNESILTEGIDDVRKHYPKISDEDFNRLIRLDPTFNENRDAVGTYGKWILNMFQKGKLDNEGHVRDALSRFDSEKKYLKNKDIGQFKSLEEIDTYLDNDDNYKTLSHRQEVRQRQNDRKNVDLDADADKLFDSADWEVWTPKTYAASCRLGQGSSWCTASTESDHYYNYYTQHGKLYINLNKHDKDEKYQFHFETSSFMDIDDRSIDLADFLAGEPELQEFYYPIIAHDLGIDLNASEIHFELTDSDTEDLFNEYDKHSRREAVSGKFIIELLNGDAYQAFEIWDYSPQINWGYLPDLNDSCKEELERLGIDEVLFQDITTGNIDYDDYDEDPLWMDIAEELEGAVKRAMISAEETGAESEAINDLIKEIAGTSSAGFQYWYEDGRFNMLATPKALMSLYMGELGCDLSATGEPFYEEHAKNIMAYHFVENFSFYEPQYGWNDFDDETFLDRLADELTYIEIETPDDGQQKMDI